MRGLAIAALLPLAVAARAAPAACEGTRLVPAGAGKDGEVVVEVRL